MTEQEKDDRRLQFNALVESELAKSRKEASKSSSSKAPQSPFYVRAAAGLGYESNPNLNSSREHDTFYEVSLDAEYQKPHDGFSVLGPGVAGLDAHLHYTEYDEFISIDNETLSFGGFADASLMPQVKARVDYDLRFLRYISRDSGNYHSHRIKSALQWAPAPSRLQAPYVTVELKDYSDRLSLTADNLFSDDKRRDLYIEPGWSMRTAAWKKTIFGVTAAYKRNDSSDAFLDFNDYTGWKSSAFLYRSFIGRVAWIGFGGYDRKAYSSRLFRVGSEETESDDLYFIGSTVYYQINSNIQLVLSYLYKQNESTDPSQEYSGYTASSGLSYTF